MKQIRNGEVVEKVLGNFHGYFHWLQKVSGLSGPLSSMLAETEFVSVGGIDDILVEKTKEEIRRKYVEDIAKEDELNDKDAETLYKSIRGDCCLFEVIVCLAYSINEMFEDMDAYDGCAHFCSVLMKNAGFDRYDEEDWDMRPEEVRAYWQKCIYRILNRTYSDTGAIGLFPLTWIEDYRDDRISYTDRRLVSLWQQMNDYVDEHTNEDGEWVD